MTFDDWWARATSPAGVVVAGPDETISLQEVDLGSYDVARAAFEAGAAEERAKVRDRSVDLVDERGSAEPPAGVTLEEPNSTVDLSSEIRYVPMEEFQAAGYLQEVNRLFFHPFGMALEIHREDEPGSEWRLFGVLDCRDDPEGIYFVDGADPDKARRVESERLAKAEPRVAALGYVVQPVGEP